ncbi:MAG TPA: hypothetical protein VM284_01185 [Candidatus Limnocylindria bacterium]|nr:hypothetical protein [Candidatus Limnocylindria bacterium]
MNPADAAAQEKVDRLFDRFERMTDAELIMLRAIWNEQDTTARQEAWTMVKVALRRSKRDRLLADARNRIGAWINNYAISQSFPDTLGQGSLSGMAQGSVRKEAYPPMLDAIAAAIVADGLDQDGRWALMKPYEAISR